MNCIAAVSRDWGIGRENQLLFHLSEDSRFFRRRTMGGTLILGRRTLESFPQGRPLPKRRHLVLSRREDWSPAGVTVCHSLRDVFREIRDLPEDEVWVIGGGEIYREFLPYCRKAYITRIDACAPADAFFPNLSDMDGWEETEQGEEHRDSQISYRFCVYRNGTPRLADTEDRTERAVSGTPSL